MPEQGLCHAHGGRLQGNWRVQVYADQKEHCSDGEKRAWRAPETVHIRSLPDADSMAKGGEKAGNGLQCQPGWTVAGGFWVQWER